MRGGRREQAVCLMKRMRPGGGSVGVMRYDKHHKENYLSCPGGCMMLMC